MCVCVAAVVPGIKGFDEDSIASHSTTHDDMQDSQVTNGITNLPHPFHGGGYMLAASYWPKVNESAKSHFTIAKEQHYVNHWQSANVFLPFYRIVL